MIDTVFYYVDSFDEYDYRLKVGEIAPHTIVFVGETKTIYKNGECYSIGDDNKVREIVRELFTGEDSPLPIATKEKLGGIIVGDILKVDDDGTLSVDTKALVEAIMADPEIIQLLNEEVVKIEGLHGKDGATPEIMNGVWYINGKSTGVRAEGVAGPQGPLGPAGKDGKDGATPEIRMYNGVGYWFINGQNTNVIAEGRNGKDGKDGKDGQDGGSGSSGSSSGDSGGGSSSGSNLQEILDRLAELEQYWNGLNTRIENEIKDLFSDWTFVKSNLFDKLDEGQIGSISNFGLQDVKEYLQAIGVWTEEDGVVKYRWSLICQKVDEISLKVALLTALEGGNFESLEGWMKSYIDTEMNRVTNSLGTMWARSSTEKIVEYMYSGLIQSSDQNITFNQLESAAKSDIQSAFSGIRTAVERTADGSDYFIAKTQLEAAIRDAKDEIVSAAMIDLKADMMNAEGSLYAYLEGRYAGINVAVTKNPQTGVVDSGVTISGDVINFDSGRSKFKGEVEATKFLAGDRNDLNITTEGNKISFNLGTESRAYFTSEGSGMLLYIKDEQGNWRKIDFSKLTLVNSTVGTTNHLDLYSLNSSGVMELSKTIYYNTYGTFYSDQAGQNKVLSSNINYFIKEDLPNIVVCRAVGGNSIQKRTELHNCSVYIRVSFNNGSMTVMLNNRRVLIAGTNIWLTSYEDSNLINISAQDIYFGTSATKLSDVHANPNELFSVKRMTYGTSISGEFNYTIYGIKDSGLVNPAYKNIFIPYQYPSA